MADRAKPSVLQCLGRLCWDVCGVRRSRRPQVAVDKAIGEEENARKAAGREPLSSVEKDLMIRNFARKQQGLPPLEAEELLEKEEQLSRLGNIERIRLLRLKPKQQADILMRIVDVDVQHLPEVVDDMLNAEEDAIILDRLFDRVISKLPLALSTSFRLEMVWSKLCLGFTEHDVLLRVACEICNGAIMTTKKMHVRDGFSKDFSLNALAKELRKETGIDWSEGKYHDIMVFAHRLALDDLAMWRWLEARKDGDETICEDNGHVLDLSDDEDGDASG